MIEVLLADDDALMRALIAEWLSEAGYRVRQAAGGEEALGMLRSGPARLLITDMDMPGLDGGQTLGEATRMWPSLAVIAISGGTQGSRQGRSGRTWVANALKLGASKALAKPFERHELLRAIEDVLRKKPTDAAHT